MKQVAGAFAAVVLVVVIVIGGWQLGWWIKGASTDRNARIQQNTYGRQNALVEAVLDDIKDAETPGIPVPQRKAIVDQVCDNAAKLTGSIQLSADAASFVAKEC